MCWLKSYFSNKCQQIIIKNASIGKLKNGVAQGSILGPLLFLIFLNAIADDMLDLRRLLVNFEK